MKHLLLALALIAALVSCQKENSFPQIPKEVPDSAFIRATNGNTYQLDTYVDADGNDLIDSVDWNVRRCTIVPNAPKATVTQEAGNTAPNHPELSFDVPFATNGKTLHFVSHRFDPTDYTVTAYDTSGFTFSGVDKGKTVFSRFKKAK